MTPDQMGILGLGLSTVGAIILAFICWHFIKWIRQYLQAPESERTKANRFYEYATAVGFILLLIGFILQGASIAYSSTNASP